MGTAPCFVERADWRVSPAAWIVDRQVRESRETDSAGSFSYSLNVVLRLKLGGSQARGRCRISLSLTTETPAL
jgi:hypothetical protein